MDTGLQATLEAKKNDLLQEREKYLADQRRAAELIKAVDVELKAISAYEQARRPAHSSMPPSSRSTDRHPRRAGVRAVVLGAIAAADDGLTRGDIIERLGLHGDKSGEMSVSNALSALVRTSRVVREGGRYVPA
jgi:hypothetical protein